MIRQEVLMLFVQGTKKILKNNLSKLIVYGYYARGDYKENSDIDDINTSFKRRNRAGRKQYF